MSYLFQSHWHGKFGNRMHQYAYASTYKRLHSVEYFTHADWEGTKLFKTREDKILDNKDLVDILNNGSIVGEAREIGRAHV